TELLKPPGQCLRVTSLTGEAGRALLPLARDPGAIQLLGLTHFCCYQTFSFLLLDHRCCYLGLRMSCFVVRKIWLEIEVNFDDLARKLRFRFVFLGHRTAFIATHIKSLIQRVAISRGARDFPLCDHFAIHEQTTYATGTSRLLTRLLKLIANIVSP